MKFKNIKFLINTIFVIGFLLNAILGNSILAQTNSPKIWITAYVDYWNIKNSVMPLENIDWTAFTHLIHFACGVDNTYEKISSSDIFLPSEKAWFTPATEVVTEAHKNKKPILIAIGGAGNKAFAIGINSLHRTNLINDMLAISDKYKYDGWDIDLEPVTASDTANLRAFICQLYDSLQTRHAWYDKTRKPILTASIVPSWMGEMFVRLEDKLDQINLMTYDMGGKWFGKTWHNNALFSRDANGVIVSKDIYGVEMTTIQKRLHQQIAFGSNKNRLGVGIEFYGYIWTGGSLENNLGEGVSEPSQRFSKAPEGPKYTEHWKIQQDYLDTATVSYKWDPVANAPYIKRVIRDGNPSNEQFISFQDSNMIKAVVKFIKDNNIGGLIIYDLGGGYLSSKYSPRDPLLQAVKRAVRFYWN
jgi:chitinase